DDTRNPEAAFGIEAEPVRKDAHAKLCDDLAIAERSIVSNLKRGDATAEGLIDVETLAIGIDSALIGVAEAIGHNACTVSVNEDDETIISISAIGAMARMKPGAHTYPDAVTFVLH